MTNNICSKIFPATAFTFDSKEKTASAFISDLGFRAEMSVFGRLYNDAYDVGLGVINHNTNKTTYWYLSGTNTTDGGTWFDLRPTGETIREFPQMKGWKMELFND
jgi:hypothetical protein